MGISRDSRHKRRATGAQNALVRKKRAFELGRQPAMTRVGAKRCHEIRVRGGNRKFRALRLDSGNFSWASEGVAKKTRVITVAYHPSNNELIRTNTLTKSAVVQIDATPFRQYYESFYGLPVNKKKPAKDSVSVKGSRHVKATIAGRQKQSKLDPQLEGQFGAGRLLACVSSRPGQSGRCDGYILEGEELAFYLKKISAKK
ncbi:40S ribosomal protein S8-B [Neolecta irregularis DAH-3]|uniref:40S ribosomal protein S8 n=1 Tax=Neolecta irregularis (strain DAH-3) TaxID=1198029 RepID=A0A1U7LTG1_NEOID|nr:40S ribosomal protein S8-B [Neolecta irregularis DAH-3]|eukprot:OLL25919.1 40S ribosomal protein S8-B [Neolecta irregularis DAH-3]